MQSQRRGSNGVMHLRKTALLGVMFIAASCTAKSSCAQETAKPDAQNIIESAAKIGAQKEENASQEHRFWDEQNAWLFGGVGAARTLDYFSTLNMRRRGRQEIFLTNDVVDNHAAFATIEAATTAASVGASYLFHRNGHHRLERWTSFVHIGLATSGAVRNYCLKTAHPRTAQ